MVHLSGNITVIRTCVVRAMLRAIRLRVVMTSVLLAGALALAGCYSDEGYQIPTRAMKELSPEMVGLLTSKNMPKDSPILVRVFKEESELEVWKQDTTGQYQLLKVYPICRWSGELGPKKVEGDRQAPEGFYSITPGLMNPNSNYYLAINVGFPNAFDKANNYTGAFLMIHGDCSSRGCYAMTDEQIGEIYSLARESFIGGQKEFQIQAYPFRMTPANLARHRNNPNMAFWRMLKEGNDHFEVTHLEPKVDVCEKHYVFDAQPPAGSTKPLAFSPSGRCPVYEVPQDIAGPALEKERNDDYQIAQLIKANAPEAPIVMGTDGGMNRVFASKLDITTPAMDNEGRLHAPPQHPGMPPPTLSGPREDPQAGMLASNSSSSSSRGLFGNLLGSKQGAPSAPPNAPQSTPQIAAATPSDDSGSSFFGNLFGHKTATPPSPAPGGTVLAGLDPTPALRKVEKPEKTETAKTEPQPAAASKPAPQIAEAPKPAARPQQTAKSQPAARPQPQSQQDANAAAPANSSGTLMRGAQPVVPTGSFDGRWAGLQ
jgi:murein L,D-transpeptidase YafK